MTREHLLTDGLGSVPIVPSIGSIQIFIVAPCLAIWNAIFIIASFKMLPIENEHAHTGKKPYHHPPTFCHRLQKKSLSSVKGSIYTRSFASKLQCQVILWKRRVCCIVFSLTKCANERFPVRSGPFAILELK